MCGEKNEMVIRKEWKGQFINLAINFRTLKNKNIFKKHSFQVILIHHTNSYVERRRSCISRQLKAGYVKSEPLLEMDSQLTGLLSWNLLACACFGKYSALPKEKGQPQIPQTALQYYTVWSLTCTSQTIFSVFQATYLLIKYSSSFDKFRAQDLILLVLTLREN